MMNGSNGAMKRIPELVILSVAAIVILTVFSGFQGVQAKTEQSQRAQEATMDRTITVVGNGQASITPDQGTITIGVETQGEKASDAITENATQMQSLISALTSAGISRDDIQTQTIQLYPQYRQTTDAQVLTPEVIGYTAANVVQVNVRDLTRLGSLLDTAVQAGGNRIQGVSFGVSDPSAAMDQARSQALSDARHKAEQLASLTGSQLAEIVTVNESSGSTPLFAPADGAAQKLAATPIEPGQQSVQVSLQVTWSLVASAAGTATPAASTRLGDQAAVAVQPDRGTAGTEITVDGQGFPPNVTVNIGLGRWQSQYQVVDTVRTDRNGLINVAVTIPSSAQSNERWAVTVTLADDPTTQIISNIFTVTG